MFSPVLAANSDGLYNIALPAINAGINTLNPILYGKFHAEILTTTPNGS